MARYRFDLDDLRRDLRFLPNQLTLLRLALLPALWVLAAVRSTVLLGIGIAVAASTDVLDGYLARRSGHVTDLGSRMDSIADHLLTTSTVLWLVWLRPAFFREQLPLLAAWASLALVALAVGWVRFRTIGDWHLYSAKLAGTLGYLFAVSLLIFDSYSVTAFHVVIGVALLAAAETLVATLAFSRTERGAKSVLPALLRSHDRRRNASPTTGPGKGRG